MGWAWGENERGCFFDFLSKHRMAGMHAELERAFFEHNQAAYGALRERGLLPQAGANLDSQDINELCASGGDAGDAK